MIVTNQEAINRYCHEDEDVKDGQACWW